MSIGAQTAGFKQGMGDVKTGLQQGGKQFEQFSTNSLLNVAKITAALYTLKKGFDFAREGAELDYASVKFERMAGSVGSLSNVMLGDLREATRGLYSDAELMARAGDFMALGLAKTHDEAVRLATVAGALNMNMNQLVLTLTNQTTMRFDTLGVTVDGFKEKVAALEAAGMSANDAFNEAFLQQAEEQILKVGHAADTTLGAFMRFEAQSANTWDRIKTKAGEFFEPFLDYLTDGMERTNRLAEAQGFLGASLSQVYQQSQGAAQIFRLTNGELVTAEQLVILYTRATRLSNFEIERAAMLQERLRPELGKTAESVSQYGAEWQKAASDAKAYFDAVNMGLSGQVAREQESIQFGLAGGYELTRTKEQLLEYAKQQIALGKDETTVWSEYSRNVGLVAQEAVGLQYSLGQIDSKTAQQQLVALGIPVAEAAQRAEDLKNGLNLIDGTVTEIGVEITAYGDTWILRLLDGTFVSSGDMPHRPNSGQMGPGGVRGSNARKTLPEMAATGGFLRPGGIFGHADGGYLGSKGPLVKVGEQGWEYAQYDPSTGAWEIIPHNKSVQMERDRALGMAGGGYLLDGNQYVTKPGNTSAFGTVGNIAPSAVTRPTRAASRPAAVSAGGQAVPAAMVLEQAAAAAADVSGAMAGSYQAGFQEFSAQIAASNAAVEKSNLKIVAILQQMMDTQMTKYDLPAAIRDGVAQVM